MSKSLHTKTITELVGAISARQLSPVELTDTLLARVDGPTGRLMRSIW